MTLLQHHLFALALIAATCSAFALFILWKNRRRFANWIFAVYISSVAWWGFWELLTLLSANEATASLRLRVEYLGVCFIPTLFYHSAAKLAGTGKKTDLITSYLCSSLFAFLISVLRHPSFLPNAISIAYLPHWGKAGPLYFSFVAFFAASVARAHQLLWKGFRNESQNLKRRQIKYFFISSVIAYVAAVPEFSLKFGVRIPYLQPFGLYAVPLHIVLLAYFIVQFRLFDIHIVVRKSLAYSVLVSFLTIGYFVCIYGIEKAFRTTLGYYSVWTSLLAFALMSLIFQPLKNRIQRLVDWLFFRQTQEQLARKMERLEEETRKAEKLRSVATLAAGLCHELRNPLQVIRTHAEFLPERYDDPAFREQCREVMRTETTRINIMLKQLMDFAKPKPPLLRPTDFRYVLDTTLALMTSEFVRRNIQLTKTYQANGARVEADPDQLRQVIMNLAINALEAIQQEGTITVRTHIEGQTYVVQFSDTGPGIDPAILPKLFEPFSTTKPDGNGLGLSIASRIIREHRGTLSADSKPGQGAVFSVRLPIIEA